VPWPLIKPSWSGATSSPGTQIIVLGAVFFVVFRSAAMAQ
jgi:hypothetical protein